MAGNFNSRPFVLIGGGIAYIIFTMMVFRSLMGGDMMKFMLLMGIAGIFLFNGFRRYWIAFLLGALAIYSQGGMGLPFFRTIPAQIMVAAVIMGYFVMDFSLKKKSPVLRWRGYYTLFLLAAAFLTARILYDRPGGANLGSGSGGLKRALEYLFAFYAFFVAYWAVLQSGAWKINIRLIAFFAISAYLVFEVAFIRFSLAARGEESVYGLSFARALYWIFALLMLAALSPGARRLFSDASFVVVSTAIMGLALISQMRASIVQACCLVMAGSVLYRRLTVGISTILLIGGTGVVFILAAFEYGNLPENIKRPISVFLGEKASDYEAAHGTRDEWRGELNRHAWQTIQENPLFGRGWTFNVEDLLSSMNVQGMTSLLNSGQLQTTASYHNAFLNIAVNNGMPTAIIFLTAVIVAGLSLTKWSIRQQNHAIKAPVNLMLLFASLVFFMFFVNGGPWETFCLAAAMGAASAVRDQAEAKELSEVPVDTIQAGAPPARLPAKEAELVAS
jgi:hypothetical protein